MPILTATQATSESSVKPSCFNCEFLETRHRASNLGGDRGMEWNCGLLSLDDPQDEDAFAEETAKECPLYSFIDWENDRLGASI